MKIENIKTFTLLKLKQEIEEELKRRTRTFTLEDLQTVVEVAMMLPVGSLTSGIKRKEIRIGRKMLIMLAFAFGEINGKNVTTRYLGKHLKRVNSSILRFKQRYDNIERGMPEFGECEEYIEEILNQSCK